MLKLLQRYPRLRRPPVHAGIFLFLGSAGIGFAAQQATSPETKGSDLSMALSALVGVVGLSSALVSMLTAVLRKREKLSRSDVITRIDVLEKDLQAHEQREEAQIRQLRDQWQSDIKDARDTMQLIRQEQAWIVRSLTDVRDDSADIKQQQHQILALLRDMTGKVAKL